MHSAKIQVSTNHTGTFPQLLISVDEFNWQVFFSFKVKEVDLDTAIKCLAQNYKIFKDSGRGLEPVTLSIADMAEMMNHRKAGKLLKYKRI